MVPNMPPFVKYPLQDINHRFVVMPWKTSLAWGLVMLGLSIVQIIANLRRHLKMSGWLKHHSEHITHGHST
jgi:hypothetical protein